MSDEQKISASEVAKHATPEDCWIVVNGKVYDLTKFAPNHPGGADSMPLQNLLMLCSTTDGKLSGLPMGRQRWIEDV